MGLELRHPPHTDSDLIFSLMTRIEPDGDIVE